MARRARLVHTEPARGAERGDDVPDTLDDLRMSLPDVARLAGVKRPVVSMWRSRSAGSARPFPAPVVSANGQDWFTAADVVDWLEDTGRGGDGRIRANAAAHTGGPRSEASPAGDPSPDPFYGSAPGSARGGLAPGDVTAFLGLTALLCLAEISGDRFSTMDAADLIDLADECDPDDELLFSEVEAFGEGVGSWARYAEELANAAFSVAGAFESLMQRRSRLRLSGLTDGGLTGKAVALAAASAVALAEDLDVTTMTFVDPTGDSDLLVAIAAACEGREVSMRSAGGDDPATRLARRRLRVHRIPGVRTKDPAAFPDDAVVVAHLPAPVRQTMSDTEMLDAVNDLAMQTGAGNRVLILGPASALTDRLPDRAARLRRDELLRTDRLRALVRLPPGLVSGRSRQRLALCCLGPDFADRPTGERFTTVADLDGVVLDDAAVDALATDLVAAMRPDFGTHAHRPAYLRPVPLRALRAEPGSLIPASPIRRRAASTRGRAAELLSVADRAGRAVPAMQPPAVVAVGDDAAAGGIVAAEVITLGAAHARGLLRVLPGVRDLTLADLPAGGLPVFDPDTLGDPSEPRWAVDRVAFERRYPHVRYTEPGDVVFVAGERPRAVVDTDGGAVVPMPARVLRSSPRSGLLPRALAAEINHISHGERASGGSGSGNWRSWQVRLIPAAQAAGLDSHLAAVDSRRAELTAALADLAAVEALLIDGVASGTIGLEPLAPDPAAMAASA